MTGGLNYTLIIILKSMKIYIYRVESVYFPTDTSTSEHDKSFHINYDDYFLNEVQKCLCNLIQSLELGYSLSLRKQDFVAYSYSKLVQLQQMNSLSSYNTSQNQC